VKNGTITDVWTSLGFGGKASAVTNRRFQVLGHLQESNAAGTLELCKQSSKLHIEDIDTCHVLSLREVHAALHQLSYTSP
jgi:hypothetical protein